MTKILKIKTLILCLLITANLTAITKDSIATEPLVNKSNQTTILEIKDADKIFKQKEEDAWDKYSSAFIALVTVFGSAFLSYKIANKQTNLAKEQLVLTKMQMEENYRVAIAQVKANNISTARIEWIQQLRPLLADLISKASQLDEISGELNALFEKYEKLSDLEYRQLSKDEIKNDDLEEQRLFKQLTKVSKKADTIFNQILLYLNVNEKEHKMLIASFEKFADNIVKQLDKEKIEITILEEDLIDKSRLVLKEAWEQAKNIN